MDPKLMQLCEKHSKVSEIENKKIIEVGSYDINGSFRHILQPMKPSLYLGIDIESGRGVDEICSVDGVISRYGAGSFDIIVSTEAIEHIKDWRVAINNLKQLCKVGGILYLTSRSRGFGYHSFPSDHWRYELDDVARIFSNWNIEVLVEDMYNGNHYGFFLKAHKTTNELIDLGPVALYNINTDRRNGLDNSPVIPGIRQEIIMRRILSESELTAEELNPPVRYW